MFNLPRVVRFTLLFVFALPFLAFAQDGGIASIAPDGLSLINFDPTDPGSVAQMLLDAVMSKQWGIVVSLAITALVAGLRKWVPEGTKLGAWFRTKLGGIVTTLLISLGMAFLTQFVAGGQFSVALVVRALSVAVGASGGWSIWKNISEALAEKKAQTAGTTAADAPTDTLNK